MPLNKTNLENTNDLDIETVDEIDLKQILLWSLSDTLVLCAV